VHVGAPVRLPEGLCRYDAVLGLAPGVAEGEQLGHAIIACVVGGEFQSAGQVVGVRESRNQAPSSGDGLDARHGLVAGIRGQRATHEVALFPWEKLVLYRRIDFHADPIVIHEQEAQRRFIASTHRGSMWRCEEAPVGRRAGSAKAEAQDLTVVAVPPDRGPIRESATSLRYSTLPAFHASFHVL